jgi:hypothetical protein
MDMFKSQKWSFSQVVWFDKPWILVDLYELAN